MTGTCHHGDRFVPPLDPKALRELRERDKRLKRDRGGFFLLAKKKA